jgi:hypothetical protein
VVRSRPEVMIVHTAAGNGPQPTTHGTGTIVAKAAMYDGRLAGGIELFTPVAL